MSRSIVGRRDGGKRMTKTPQLNTQESTRSPDSQVIQPLTLTHYFGNTLIPTYLPIRTN